MRRRASAGRCSFLPRRQPRFPRWGCLAGCRPGATSRAWSGQGPKKGLREGPRNAKGRLMRGVRRPVATDPCAGDGSIQQRVSQVLILAFRSFLTLDPGNDERTLIRRDIFYAPWPLRRTLRWPAWRLCRPE